MKNENERKGFLERLLAGRNQNKNACCCGFEIVELPDDVTDNESKEAKITDTPEEKK